MVMSSYSHPTKARRAVVRQGDRTVQLLGIPPDHPYKPSLRIGGWHFLDSAIVVRPRELVGYSPFRDYLAYLAANFADHALRGPTVPGMLGISAHPRADLALSVLSKSPAGRAIGRHLLHARTTEYDEQLLRAIVESNHLVVEDVELTRLLFWVREALPEVRPSTALPAAYWFATWSRLTRDALGTDQPES
jgi:hypothetical protein